VRAHGGLKDAPDQLDGISWDGIYWDEIRWDEISWDGISWDGISWEGTYWDGISCEGISWERQHTRTSRRSHPYARRSRGMACSAATEGMRLKSFGKCQMLTLPSVADPVL
jgi:hypothetical protein